MLFQVKLKRQLNLARNAGKTMMKRKQMGMMGLSTVKSIRR
jgi:hypothetical protein